MKQFFFLARYITTGLSGAVIQTIFLYTWVSLLGLKSTYLLGLSIGFIIALVVTFTLQKYWTFHDHEAKRIPRQFLTYGAVALSGLVLNVVLLAGAKALSGSLGINFFASWYLLAQIIAAVIVAFSNLCLNSLITFRSSKQRIYGNK